MTARLHVYAAPRERTSPVFCAAFAAGAQAPVVDDGALRPGDVALFGSPTLWDMMLKAQRLGRTLYYGDKAYFGRDRYYRVTRDAYQAVGELPRVEGAARARAEAVLRGLAVRPQPWRHGNAGHVLVCPSGDAHASMMRRAGYDVGDRDAWTDDVLAQLAVHTNRPVRVRTKDDYRQGRPLSEDLSGCWAVVTYTSMVALEAVMAGIPAFVLGPSAAAALGCADLTRIETPCRPCEVQRWEHALALAARQWTLDELAHGEAWRSLN